MTGDEPQPLPLIQPTLADWPIDYNVPIPADRSGGKRVEWDKARLPFSRLDRRLASFACRPEWFPGAGMIETQNWISGAACSYGRKNGLYFTTRQMRDGTVRCWRIDASDKRGRGDRRPIDGIDT